MSPHIHVAITSAITFSNRHNNAKQWRFGSSSAITPYYGCYETMACDMYSITINFNYFPPTAHWGLLSLTNNKFMAWPTVNYCQLCLLSCLKLHPRTKHFDRAIHVQCRTSQTHLGVNVWSSCPEGLGSPKPPPEECFPEKHNYNIISSYLYMHEG